MKADFYELGSSVLSSEKIFRFRFLVTRIYDFFQKGPGAFVSLAFGLVISIMIAVSVQNWVANISVVASDETFVRETANGEAQLSLFSSVISGQTEFEGQSFILRAEGSTVVRFDKPQEPELISWENADGTSELQALIWDASDLLDAPRYKHVDLNGAVTALVSLSENSQALVGFVDGRVSLVTFPDGDTGTSVVEELSIDTVNSPLPVNMSGYVRQITVYGDYFTAIDQSGHRVSALLSRSREDVSKFASILKLPQSENTVGRETELLSRTEILGVIADYPSINIRVRDLQLIGNRRWDIVLEHGVRVNLPQGYAANDALDVLNSIQRMTGILDRQVSRIDLRDPARVYVQTSETN